MDCTNYYYISLITMYKEDIISRKRLWEILYIAEDIEYILDNIDYYLNRWQFTEAVNECISNKDRLAYIA